MNIIIYVTVGRVNSNHELLFKIFLENPFQTSTISQKLICMTEHLREKLQIALTYFITSFNGDAP